MCCRWKGPHSLHACRFSRRGSPIRGRGGLPTPGVFSTRSRSLNGLYHLFCPRRYSQPRAFRNQRIAAVTYFLRQNRVPSSFLNPNLRSAAAPPPLPPSVRPAGRRRRFWRAEVGRRSAAGENFAILDPESVDFNEFSVGAVGGASPSRRSVLISYGRPGRFPLSAGRPAGGSGRPRATICNMFGLGFGFIFF